MDTNFTENRPAVECAFHLLAALAETDVRIEEVQDQFIGRCGSFEARLCVGRQLSKFSPHSLWRGIVGGFLMATSNR